MQSRGGGGSGEGNPRVYQPYTHFQQNQNSQQPQVFIPQQPFVPPTFAPPANYHYTVPPAPHHDQGGFAHDFIASTATNYFMGQVQDSERVVQKVQERMGFISSFILNYHFAVSTDYVKTKLLMLLFPYLKKWKYARLPEQIPGGPKYRAPRVDINCPDLYIPLMAFFTYCVISCLPSVVQHTFTPDVLYTKIYKGLVGWLVNTVLLKFLVHAMSMPSAISFIEALCYTGYMFVQICLLVAVSLTNINYMPVVMWLYVSLCISVFLVKSLKTLMRHEARHYGGDVSKHNYLLLLLAFFQFGSVYLMGT